MDNIFFRLIDDQSRFNRLMSERYKKDWQTTVSNSSSFIELPYHFLNPVTKTVWKLDIKDEKLIVIVPNFNFEIAPSSTSKFRPVNPSINIEIEFEKHDKNELLLMHLYAKGIKRATFEAI